MAERDPLSQARERGKQGITEILQAQGGVISEQAMLDRLQMSKEDLATLRNEDRIIAFPAIVIQEETLESNSEYVYPVWQTASNQNRLLPGLEEILLSMGEVRNPYMRAAFLLNNSSEESKSRLDIIREGRAQDIIREAKIYGTQGPI